MTYMLAAYAVIWILTFVFITSIFLRQRSLQQDIQLMEQLLRDGAADKKDSE